MQTFNIFIINISESLSMTTKQIEKYVGKDLWVLCMSRYRTAYSYTFMGPYYYRFLSMESDHVHYNCVIPEHAGVRCSSPYELPMKWGRRQDFKLASPTDIKTTRELFQTDVPTEKNLKIFTKFQGKPFWIHAESEEAAVGYGDGVGGYIKIAHVNGLEVSGHFYEDYFVYDYEHLDSDDIRENEDYSPSDCGSWFRNSVDNWIIDDPIEALSEEEFDEIMDHNDAIFEEAKYGEDPDDVDDYDDGWE